MAETRTGGEADQYGGKETEPLDTDQYGEKETESKLRLVVQTGTIAIKPQMDQELPAYYISEVFQSLPMKVVIEMRSGAMMSMQASWNKMRVG
eukprot:361897-Hanusia_phi.AAC.1